MDPFVKKSKKNARKAGAETKSAVQTNVNPSAEKYTSSWEEEQLVDYEPEEPAASFSPVEEDIYSGKNNYPAHGDGPEEDNTPITDDFSVYPAEGADMAGRKRSQNVFQEGEPSRKTSRSIGVGSSLQEGNNSQSVEEQMDLARERGSRSTSTALPMGASDASKTNNPWWQSLKRGK
jgi:hypothetical protein